MNPYPKIILKPGKEAPVLRFHPWIFSGAIQRIEGKVTEGDIAECYSANGQYLATGHVLSGSLAVKLFAFQQQTIDDNFWLKKIQQAWNYRKQLGLTDNPHSNAYRLIHNEGDGFPGLIIDIYDTLAVLQAHSLGMHDARHALARALVQVSEGNIQAVYDKSAETIRKMTGVEVTDSFLMGDGEQQQVLENDLKFLIQPVTGQKTGFFLDQRENRQLIARYSAGRNVLNMFSYTGGFSVYAANAGAKSVVTVDSSAGAIELAKQNLKLNGFEGERYLCLEEDAKRYLEQMEADKYDLIVLDPPAYAKNIASRTQALKGYRRINALAMAKIKSGGILFTFSCSQVVDKQMFASAITAAALDANRQVQIMHQLCQPADHPISLYHPEGEYLKGLVLRVV